MKKDRPIIVAISGLSSNTGKTTLMCELLERLPGWEAIKLTRGHYRSCGKDPHGCCVSDLIRDEPLIRSDTPTKQGIPCFAWIASPSCIATTPPLQVPFWVRSLARSTSAW